MNRFLRYSLSLIWLVLSLFCCVNVVLGQITWTQTTPLDCGDGNTVMFSNTFVSLSDNEGSPCGPCFGPLSGATCGDVLANEFEGVMDVSGFSSVSVRIDVSAIGDLECNGENSQDIVVIAVSNNCEAPSNTFCGSVGPHNFGAIDVTLTDELFFFIQGGTSSADEVYQISFNISPNSGDKVIVDPTSDRNRVCVGETVRLSANSQNCNSGCSLEWRDSNGFVVGSGENTTVIPNSIGSQIFTLWALKNGCETFLEVVVVDVPDQVSNDFVLEDACTLESIDLDTDLGGFDGTWTGDFVEPSGSNQSFNTAAAGVGSHFISFNPTAACSPTEWTIEVSAPIGDLGFSALGPFCNDGTDPAFNFNDPVNLPWGSAGPVTGTWTYEGNTITAFDPADPIFASGSDLMFSPDASGTTCTAGDQSVSFSLISCQVTCAGMDVSFEFCPYEAANVNFWDSIGVDPGHSFPMTRWTEVIVGAGSGIDLISVDFGSVDFSDVAPGDYEFNFIVLDDGNGCVNDTAIIDISVLPVPNAGDDTMIPVDCYIDSEKLNLYDFLNGNPDENGTWSLISGAGNMVDTGTDSLSLVGMGQGSFVFEYTVTNGFCENSSQLSIDIRVQEFILDAMVRLCQNGPGDLQNVIPGSGSWRGTNITGFRFFDTNITIDPSIDADTFMVEYIPAPCGTPVIQTIILQAAPDAGRDTTYQLCNSDVTVNLFSSFSATADRSGVWDVVVPIAGFDPVIAFSDPENADMTNLPSGSSQLVYRVTNPPVTGCTSTTLVTIVKEALIPAGTDYSFSICSNSAPVDLIDSLRHIGGIGTILPDPDNLTLIDLTNPKSVSFVGALSGTYGFVHNTSNLTPACTGSSATITVIVEEFTDAGENATVSVCSDIGSPLSFLDELGGTPQAGGQWMDNDATGLDLLTDINNVDISGLSGGTYTFDYVTGIGSNCDDRSMLTLNIEEAPFAGNNTDFIICMGDNNLFNLNDSIAVNAGDGVWTPSGGVNIGDGSSVDLSDLPATLGGNFVFTHEVSPIGATCTNTYSAIVRVQVLEDADAGDPTVLDLCEDGSVTSLDLFSEIGAGDRNGTWRDIATGASITDPTNFDLSTISADGLGLVTVAYEYTVDLVSCIDIDTLTINNYEFYFAGFDNAFTICEGDMTLYNLNDSLMNGNSIGSWSTANPTIPVVLADGDMVDLSNLPVGGPYEFEFVTQSNIVCIGDRASINVVVTEAPNTGETVSQIVCSEFPTINLIDLMGGSIDPGGTWTLLGPNIIIPNPEATLTPPSGIAFQYEYRIDTGCTSNNILTVTTVDPRSAGMNNDLPVCQGETAPQDFDAQIASPNPGSWTETSANISGVDFTLSSEVDFTNVIAGVYTFEFTVQSFSPVCDPQVSVLTVSVFDQAFAGADSTNVNFCQGTVLIDLNDYRDPAGDDGGVWSDDTGVINDPENYNLTAIALSTSTTLTYSVGANGCDDELTFVFQVQPRGNPGRDLTINACSGILQVFNLVDSIGPFDPGGQWSTNNPANVVLAAPDNVAINGFNAGITEIYYVVPGNVGCPPDTATVTVIITDPPNTGGDQSIADPFCSGGSNVIDLATLLGTGAEPGGRWFNTNETPEVEILDPSNYDIGALSQGNYLFRYEFDRCAANAVIIFDVSNGLDAGSSGVIPALCNDNLFIINMDVLLGSHDAGGDWELIGDPSFIISDATMVDVSSLPAGNYTFRYFFNTSGCGMSAAELTLEIFEAPDAGLSQSSVSVCAGSTIDLSQYVNGNGVFSEITPSGALTGSDFNSSGLSNGLYPVEYTLAAPAGSVCNDDIVTIDVDVTQSLDAGDYPNPIRVCRGDVVRLNDIVSGDLGGVFTELSPSGFIINGNELLTDNISGPFIIQYSVGDDITCPSDVAEMTFVVINTPSIELFGEGTLCEEQCEDFEIELTGTAPLMVDYLYTVNGFPFSEMSITYNDLTNTVFTVCSRQGPVEIFNDTLFVPLAAVDLLVQPDRVTTVGSNCDSGILQPNPNLQISLILSTQVDSMIEMSLCPGENLVIGGVVFDETNTTDIVTVTGVDCDTVFDVSLTFFENARVDTTESFCFGDTIDIGGERFFSGNESSTINLQTVNGCDSIINVNFTFSPEPMTSIRSEELCPGEVFPFNGVDYSTDIQLFDTLAMDANGCPLEIEIIDVFTATCTRDPFAFASNPISCFGESDGNIEINGNDLEPGEEYSYTWTESNSSANGVGLIDPVLEQATILNLPPGDYFVQVLDSNGDVVQETLIPVQDKPMADIDVILSQDISCPDSDDAILFVDGIIGFNDQVNILWSNDSTSLSIEGLSSGWYYVTATDGSCTAFDSIEILPLDPIQFTVDPQDPLCDLVEDGMITVNVVSGGIGPFEYSINNEVDFGNTPLFMDLGAGDYDLFVRDANQCVAGPEMVTLDLENSGLISLTDTIDAFIGDTITLDLELGFTADQILWSSSNLSCTDCQNPNLMVTQNQTITVTVEDEFGCTFTDETYIRVSQDFIEVFIPNVIDMTDGVNGSFFASGSADLNLDYDMEIYDRYGNVMFSKKDIPLNIPEEGWGMFFNSQGDLIPGVYIYRIEYRVDGVLKTRRGNVTVVR